jgi:hypothetical protein
MRANHVRGLAGVCLVALAVLLALAPRTGGQVGCPVLCIGSQCWQDFPQLGSKNVLVVTNGVIVTYWYASKAGCAPDKCYCAGFGPKYKAQQATATPPCIPLQSNSADVPIPIGKKATDICTNPVGKVFEDGGCFTCAGHP